MKIVRVGMETNSGQYLVVLTDFAGSRALVIWIGPFEANAISSEIEGVVHPRPMTHDLLGHVIHEAGFTVQRVVITHVSDGTYHAFLAMEKEGRAVRIDARPSDSLVMALKFQAPIFATRSLLRERAVSMQSEGNVENQYGFSLQELTHSLARAFAFPSTKGALISDISKGGPAESSGLSRGDILVEVNGNRVKDVNSAREEFTAARGEVRVKIFRRGGYTDLRLPSLDGGKR
jgi:bifunctional DNase/RNase